MNSARDLARPGLEAQRLSDQEAKLLGQMQRNCGYFILHVRILKLSGVQKAFMEAPKPPQEASRGPKISSRSAKIAPR